MAKLHVAQELIDIMWPVGSIYISVNNTSPQTLFGGSWTRIPGMFLLGADPSTSMEHKTAGLNLR